MAFDAIKNFAYSTISVAPIPATSGTAITVASGDGTKFPAVSFNATVWPAGQNPTTANAEIVRVTVIATDVFTITRAQEGSAARTIVVGDQIAATITAKSLTDIQTNGAFVTPDIGAATGASLVLSSKLNEAKGADIASSGTTDIGAATGNYVNITGTTTITALGTVQAGTRRNVNFNGALTLTHNATSLILPGGANITTVAGDTATFISLGSGNWICLQYQKTTVTGTGGAVQANTPSLTTPNIGAATGTSLAATGLISSSSPSAGIGYATGAGSTVTQLTSKSTAVTINAICGAITTHNASLSTNAVVAFTVNNTSCAAADTPFVALKSGDAAQGYIITVTAVAANSFEIQIFNATGGNRTDALVINFSILKSVTS